MSLMPKLPVCGIIFLNCLSIRISALSASRLKEFYCIQNFRKETV